MSGYAGKIEGGVGHQFYIYPMEYLKRYTEEVKFWWEMNLTGEKGLLKLWFSEEKKIIMKQALLKLLTENENKYCTIEAQRKLASSNLI